jgi:hypothetical protein
MKRVWQKTVFAILLVAAIFYGQRLGTITGRELSQWLSTPRPSHSMIPESSIEWVVSDDVLPPKPIVDLTTLEWRNGVENHSGETILSQL